MLDGDELKPELAKRGIVLHRELEPSISIFLLQHGRSGRRRLHAGEDRAAPRDQPGLRPRRGDPPAARTARRIPARSRLPPALFGHDPHRRDRTATIRRPRARCSTSSATRTATATAIARLPDGKPLTLVKASTTDAAARASDELWKRNMDAIGIRITFLKNKWPELNKMSEAGQLMMWGLGWISAIPDGDAFYSYLYSNNIGTSNDARLRLPEYDELYEEAHALPDGPERTALFRQMNELIVGYAPWILADYRYRNCSRSRGSRATSRTRSSSISGATTTSAAPLRSLGLACAARPIAAIARGGSNWRYRPILFARTSPASQAALIGADRLKAAWQLSGDGCGRDGRRRNRLRLCKRPCCAGDGVRGPRYKPPERTLFEFRRSATRVIAGVGWNARQQNSRARLSFGLTSSCYRVEQHLIGS